MGPVRYVIKDSHTSERHRINVLPIIRERHIGLTEANGVFPLSNTIVNLKFLLGDALRGDQKRRDKERGQTTNPAREVHFNTKDPDILGAGTLSLSLKDRRGRCGERRSGSFDGHWEREE